MVRRCHIFFHLHLMITFSHRVDKWKFCSDELVQIVSSDKRIHFAVFFFNLHLVVLHRPTVLLNQNFSFQKTKFPKGKASNIYAHGTYVVSFEYRPSMQRQPFLTVHQFASMFSTQARTTFHEPWVTRIRESCARGATLENMAGPRLYAAQGDSTRERGLPCRRVWNLLKISNGRNEWHSTARRPK